MRAKPRWTWLWTGFQKRCGLRARPRHLHLHLHLHLHRHRHRHRQADAAASPRPMPSMRPCSHSCRGSSTTACVAMRPRHLRQRELRDWLRRRNQVVIALHAQKQRIALASPAVRRLMAATIAAESGVAGRTGHAEPTADRQARGCGTDEPRQRTNFAQPPPHPRRSRLCALRCTWPRCRRCAGIR